MVFIQSPIQITLNEDNEVVIINEDIKLLKSDVLNIIGKLLTIETID
jgi:hypothetical protein